MHDPTRENSDHNHLVKLTTQFVELYGKSEGQHAISRLLAFSELQIPTNALLAARLDQRAAFLITYGDQLNSPGENPLSSLAAFCEAWLSGIISTIHVLPFFPYSSDDGFSVIDYLQVDPKLGSWQDIQALRQKFKLMFDLVINHTSVSHAWFAAFLQGEVEHEHYYIAVDGHPDLSTVTRPRALPLLTEFRTQGGVKRVWTTFSQDQADLNFSNPDVLLEILKILQIYIERGAEFIRLDAIAYLWKEIGTACIHLPQTHRIVKLLRTFLDLIAPQVCLITETNVPHADNIAYFGDGQDEAQLVYNFALPPLVLHAFQTGKANILSEWAASLVLPSKKVTFFNFLASHDGIGLTPAKDMLSEAEFSSLVECALKHGGRVSYKHNPDGSESPYELNINYFDALSDPGNHEPVDIPVDRFCAAHAIMLSLIGVPGIYFHSLFGSRGWSEGIELTGRFRSINRQKLTRQELEDKLNDHDTLRSKVFSRLSSLLKIRQIQPAFNPFGSQQILDFGDRIFALFRIANDPRKSILCLHNVSAEEIQLRVQTEHIWEMVVPSLVDLISGEQYPAENSIALILRPYQVHWLGIHDPDTKARKE